MLAGGVHSMIHPFGVTGFNLYSMFVAVIGAVVAVMSGKGGVGKSTVAANLAVGFTF